LQNKLCGSGGCFSSILAAVDNHDDADRVLSFYTKQQVMFLDAKLGAPFYLLQVGIAVFIVVYIFIMKQGYLQFEQARGASVTHVSGDAVSVSSGASASRYFSVEELTYPGMENGNVFIATRQEVHTQMRGFCEDPDMPCATNADCTARGEGVCSEIGLCKEHSWCNVETEPEKYEMASDLLQIWTRSFIQYVKLAPQKLFTTEAETAGPNEDYTFTVRQLLMMCTPLPVNYEEVAELGAVFEVGFRWECNVKLDECTPKVNVRRLDTILDPDNIGFGFKHAEYLDDGHRVQNAVRGLRFFFRTTGVGRKVSVAATMLNASTSSTLLAFAAVIADLLLGKVFSRRKKYNARKFENTPDFSEYIAELEEKKKQSTQVTDLDKAETMVVQKEEQWLLQFQEDAA